MLRQYLLRYCLISLAIISSGCLVDSCDNPLNPSSGGQNGKNVQGGQSGKPFVYIHPNVASRDMLDMFRHPEQWAKARSRITVFAFYGGQANNDICELCGPNTYNNFMNVVPGGAFKWLNDNGIQISLEVGSVKPYDCGSNHDTEVRSALRVIANVKAAGAIVSYLAMDEPFAASLPSRQGYDTFPHCNYTMEQTAQRVKYFIDGINSVYPEVQVGLVEPYSYLSIQDIEDAITALENIGVRLPFFHLDFDPIPGERINDYTSDVRDIQSFCKLHGIPFGVIVIGAEGSSTESAYSGARVMISRLNSMIGLLSQDHILFQSWLDYPPSRGKQDLRLYPDNIPETNPYTMTALINESMTSAR